ncbi:polar amino acid transport system substrate-binding protein [Sinorhizobium terangae]|uniref:Transporter substrate-binding domain-containing protein n=1 Tax=Sinorhizobium terangae TaxID=110322 RepID=A0A6N7LL02_SINTE|nr:transporter substrate-binding domain-containing protein [Sinorhizobium terangae]MBB4185340.1 polar amino acid transport system substrate-binding protein [Sinorhizobium terangae]MQX17424.1 transporter substrate-binding domain-containing protein [Sinorhizobium terangae]
MKHLILAFLLGLSATAHAETIHFVTEEYPPYNFSTANGVNGSSVEQVALIMRAINLPYETEVLPWARAFALAENQPFHCVFTTGHDAERDRNFKWVEPLLVDHMIMVRRKGAAIAPQTIDEAKEFVVGTQRGDFSAAYLKAHGFDKIDYAANLDSTMKKLAAGRIDLLMTSEKTFETMRADGIPVEAVLVLEGKQYGIACHRDMPDETIARMQAELNRLIASGTQDRIFERYGLRPNRIEQAAK